jgi:hypothetical protein
MPQISTEEFERRVAAPLTKYSSRDEHSFSILGAPRLPGFGKHGTQLDATDLFF